MEHLTDIVMDLQEIDFVSSLQEMVPPYCENLSDAEIFNTLYKNLKRAIKLKNRLSSLINAFYLGQFLDQLSSNREQSNYRGKLTRHYEQVVRYIFDVFEPCPEQILKTKFVGVAVLRNLKREEINYLRDELIYFAGAQF